MATREKPVQHLYRLLCELDSAEILHQNLLDLEDYASMEGGPEPRFREWAFTRRRQRKLHSGLLGNALRPADAMKLARLAGVPQVQGQSPEVALNLTLICIGFRQAEVPLPVMDGVAELRQCLRALDLHLRGLDTHEDGPAFLDPLATCRRGAERMLKVLCCFIIDAGFDGSVRRAAIEGVGGFRPMEAEPPSWASWIMGADLGTLNHLLRAVGLDMERRDRTLPFLEEGRPLWSKEAHGPLHGLSGALNLRMHDSGVTQPVDQQKQYSNVYRTLDTVLRRVDEQDPAIRLPRTVQFYGREEDGTGVHYKGYTHEGQRRTFYDCPEQYDFHRPYLYMAATNPAPVDPVCVVLRDEFTRKV